MSQNRSCMGADTSSSFSSSITTMPPRYFGRRYRHLRSFPRSILVLSLLLRASVATVTLLSESDSRSVATYPSHPAAFGNEFEWGLEYGARVQLPPDGDWWLCGDDAKPPTGDVDFITGKEGFWAENADPEEAAAEESAWEFRRLRHRLAKDDTAERKVSASASGKGNVIVPPDGMPGK